MIYNILEYLEASAQKLPEKVAFYDDREKLTYAQLVKVSKAIGSALTAVSPMRTPVAALMDGRSIKNVSAFLGIVYAGCANAPFDITMPTERLALLLDLLAPSAILADEKGREALKEINVTVPVINYEDAINAAIDDAALAHIRMTATAMDPMSILYTSGSTGVPKGSIQPMISYIMWNKASIDRYGFNENTIVANQSPFFYANSILDIFPPITVGGTVYILPSGALTFPKKFVGYLKDHHITQICMTPSSYVAVANAGVLEPGILPDLRYGEMSGESMPWTQLKMWMDATPNASWWHFYGSTEMFAVSSSQVVGEHEAGDRLTSGRPYPMTDIIFLNEDGTETAPGEPGEIYVANPWLSTGYHRDPVRTAESWVVDPLEKGWQERFYRSGDLGYFTPEGELMVVGHRDNQLKHFGYRMELADVDKGLQAIPEVKESCVMHVKESTHIYCFYVGDLDEKALDKELKVRLQPYMLPDYYVRLDEMPHTASMKIGRAVLTKMMNEMEEKLK